MNRQFKQALADAFHAPPPTCKAAFLKQYRRRELGRWELIALQIRYIRWWVWLLSLAVSGFILMTATLSAESPLVYRCADPVPGAADDHGERESAVVPDGGAGLPDVPAEYHTGPDGGAWTVPSGAVWPAGSLEYSRGGSGRRISGISVDTLSAHVGAGDGVDPPYPWPGGAAGLRRCYGGNNRCSY